LGEDGPLAKCVFLVRLLRLGKPIVAKAAAA